MFALPLAVRRSGLVLKASQEIFFQTRQPFVEGLPGDAEMPGRERCLLAVLFPEDDPFEAPAGREGEPLQLSDFPPSVVLVSQFVLAGEIPGFEPEPPKRPLGFIPPERGKR